MDIHNYLSSKDSSIDIKLMYYDDNKKSGKGI